MIMSLMIFAIGITTGHPIENSESDENEVTNEVTTYDFPFITRPQWLARTATNTTALTTPVPYVVIHHSYIPKACYSAEECGRAMRGMQNYHMDEHGWWDIGYNFAVGSDGAAYEGRGWKLLGAHSLHFNSVSIGICVIGDWTSKLPPADQIKTTKALIAAGVDLGFIKPDYKLVGHRQVRATECPGDRFYEDVKTWDHYSAFPASSKDLLKVDELPEWVKETIRNETRTTKLPPADQIKTTKALIAAGVDLGFIKPDYKLVGHRQVRATECPGDRFYEDVKTWDHYSAFPASSKDLLKVDELPEWVKETIRNETRTS